ncbi:6-bladed beta-propeller [Phocaeicola sp.]
MKRSIPLSVLLAAGAFAACTSSVKSDGTISTVEQNGNTLTLCDFSKVKDTLDIPLSEWVEDCQVVRFEDADTALFKFWWPAITDNYIGIRQQGGAFKLFDHQGKFLCDIGTVGQGPGEYSGSLYSEAIDEKNRCIYLAPFFGSTKILKYNMDGTFASDIDLGEQLNKPKLGLHPDGGLSVVHLCFEGRSEMMAAHIAKDGTVTKYMPAAGQAVNPRDKNGNFVGFNNEIWSYANVEGLKFMSMPIDTLYNYNAGANRLEARFALSNPPVGDDVFLIYDELPGKFLATVWGTGTIAVDTKKQNSHYVKLVNDFFGGLPAPMNFTNGWFFAMYEPMVLMERIEKRLADASCSEKDKEVLNKLLASLDEDDNNVMFIGKLKQ